MKKQEIINLLKPIVVVKILDIKKHPNADRLLIVSVDLGKETKDVITGANNFKIGDYVPYLGLGEVVPGYLIMKGEKIVLEKRKLRGIDSDCMILAEDEIGLSNDHQGIYIIDSSDLKDEIIGKSFFDLLTEEQLNKIIENSKNATIQSTININKMKNLSLEERIKLIKSVGEEIIGEDELPALLLSNKELITYDGFEPSGQMHIAQGIQRAINANKMIEAGFKFKMLVADWFGYLNNKMGGDIEKIKVVGKYFIEIWRASGMNLNGIEFIWTSDMIKDTKYWELVMKVARTTTLNRILRTTQIMGRSETDELSAAQIIYPSMQTADIFTLGAQVTELGMDQRKVNMLAREIGNELGFWKPIVVSHHMLQGLGKSLEGVSDPTERAIAMKMSKSIPDSAIFMTDTTEDIKRKIIKAYCPEGDIKENPILEYCKYIIFEAVHLKGQENLLEDGFVIKRPEKFGGDVVYKTYPELEKDFASKALFPLDLKNAVIEYIDRLVEPVRKHFIENKEAKEILKQVQSFQITR